MISKYTPASPVAAYFQDESPPAFLVEVKLPESIGERRKLERALVSGLNTTRKTAEGRLQYHTPLNWALYSDRFFTPTYFVTEHGNHVVVGAEVIQGSVPAPEAVENFLRSIFADSSAAEIVAKMLKGLDTLPKPMPLEIPANGG